MYRILTASFLDLITGTVAINANGDRKAGYSILDLNEDDKNAGFEVRDLNT